MKRCSLPVLALLSVLLVAGVLVAVPPAADAATWSPPAEPTLVPVAATGCRPTPQTGQATCLSETLHVSDAAAETAGAEAHGFTQVRPQATVPTGGYSPADLASIYKIPAGLAPTATVGIVDVGSDPNTQAQMSYFRSTFRLPACTKAGGCFREVAQDGSAKLPATDSDWVVETALDVQAVSAICPTCHILLVDAASASITDLAKAALTATRLGAAYVSLSFGSAESTATTSLRNTYYNEPDVTYVAAAGDGGYDGGALFPASAPNIVAAGGTSIKLVNGAWQQSAWSGSGSGCSTQHAMTAAQALASLSSVCRGKRVVSDVSALADPATGMLFYRGGGWYDAGGTSLAAPILTALYALAGNHTSPFSFYADASTLVDVTSGSTGTCSPAKLCSAGPGWDGPTGLGTPASLDALAAGAKLPVYVTSTSGGLSYTGGYPARLGFHLADGDTGAAVRTASVQLQRSVAGGPFRTVHSGATNSAGNVSFLDTPTKPAAYRVVFAGDAGHDGSTSNTVSLRRFLPVVRLHQRAGHLRAKIRAPWGPALKSATVRLQRRNGRYWISIRRLRTDTHGVVVADLQRGKTYRLRYGGAGWQVGHTAPVTAR
ncbi:hypothetical protein P5P86_11420 [Nocardioides sp. BP30]|uniref:S53 family peptidase n=1 Tax=Nocardioides sp. BP30 TaxID=3036374 RepID=UPI002469A593|nr:hypothetical protein [Nocardioides sp. BP30]WGL50572.1 hypothetical protein P5P86_11420 [Nocardioides sp. BP30]